MDYYLNDINCAQRLYNDYKKYGTLIIALDYDNTIFDFFNKGLIFNDVISLVKECSNIGMKIVIYTASQEYDKIETYCKKIGLKIEGININILEQFAKSGKIYYNILLDDRAGLASAYNQLNWVLDRIKEEKNDLPK